MTTRWVGRYANHMPGPEEPSALRRLAGDIAHELNNTLLAILGELELLDEAAENPAEVRALSARLHEATARARSLADRLEQFSLGGELVLEAAPDGNGGGGERNGGEGGGRGAPGGPPPPRDGVPATVLVVDDEDEVRELIEFVLRRHGYQVVAARTSDEALEQAARAGGALALLVTDLRMPGLDGRALAERLRAQRPALRVLCLSGLQPTPEDLPPDADLLRKPFELEELLEHVRRAVGK